MAAALGGTMDVDHAAEDHHADQKPALTIDSELRKNLPQLDHALHALVTDIHERGLEKDIAVVVAGEMGRTPRISKTAGRDHWPQAGFALLAGGGFKTGQVIGATDARGALAACRRT